MTNNTVLVDTLQLQKTSIDPEITIEQDDLDLPLSEDVRRPKGARLQICQKVSNMPDS